MYVFQDKEIEISCSKRVRMQEFLGRSERSKRAMKLILGVFLRLILQL